MTQVENPPIRPSLQEESLGNSSTSVSSVQERWRKVLVKKNKGFLAQPINQVGFELSQINYMFPPLKDPPEVAKTLFPRSVIYEIPYKKKQAEIKIQEALRKEREALAERVKMKLAQTTQQDNHQQIKQPDGMDKEMDRLLEEKKPFWYDENKKTVLPGRNLSEYDVDKGLRVDRPEDVNVREMMGIADSRNYIPGQVSGNIPTDTSSQFKTEAAIDREMAGVQLVPHPALPYMSSLDQTTDEITETEKNINMLQSECHPKKPDPPAGLIDTYPIDYMKKKGRNLERPKVSPGYEFGKTDLKGRVCKDFPGNKARLTTPWGDLRSEEFIKVGRPFKSQAARWTECSMPAFKPEEELQAIRERLMKKYQIKSQ